MRKLRLEELGRLDLESYRKKQKLPLVVVLDNVRSMHNVGSVFRSSDAFLIQKIYLCGITAKPPHKEIRKTAIGATDSVSWEYFGNTLDLILDLQAQNWTVLCVEQTTQSVALQDFELDEQKKYAVVLGNEVDGVNQEVINASQTCLELPQFGTKHSLNVSVCAGIVLWELTKPFH